MEFAAESKETTYFDEEASAAKEVVEREGTRWSLSGKSCARSSAVVP